MIAYLRSLSGLELFNVTLALLAALAAFGSINLMRQVACHVDVMQTVIVARRGGASWFRSLLAGMRSVETMSIACGFVTVASGLVGQAFGQLAGVWQNGFDTLTYGGMLALLVSNRRSLAFVSEYRHGTALGITGACWMIFFAHAH